MKPLINISKTKIILVLSLMFVSLTAFNSAHKFYVSVTEIEYAPTQRSLQIIVRVFTDDFQKMLKQKYDPSIVLIDGKEIPTTNQYIKTYFDEKFAVSLHGKKKELNFIGKRYDKDLLVLYFEINEVEDFSKITIKNLILTELFEDQKNLVHVERFDQTKSLLLTQENPIGILNF